MPYEHPKTPQEVLCVMDAMDRQDRIDDDITALMERLEEWRDSWVYDPETSSTKALTIRRLVEDMCRQARVTVDDLPDYDRLELPSKQQLERISELNSDYDPQVRYELYDLAAQVGVIV